MKNTHPSMMWGDELAPHEMQATNGGDFFEVLIGVSLVDFFYNLWREDGDVAAAAMDTREDLTALWNAIKSLTGTFAA
jgi:hypothetical protein